MTETVEKIRTSEKRIGGLVITKALYGKLINIQDHHGYVISILGSPVTPRIKSSIHSI